MPEPRTYKIATFVLAVIGLLVAVGAWLYPQSPAEVVREPVATAGPNPFMPPVAVDQAEVTPKPTRYSAVPRERPGRRTHP